MDETQHNSISAQKPQSIWHRPVNANFRSLLIALTKGAISGAFRNWEELAKSGVDILDALGLEPNKVEGIAWLLVQRSLLQTMTDLTKEYRFCRKDGGMIQLNSIPLMSSTDRSEFMSHPALFKWKHFQPEIILLTVRWYCRYALGSVAKMEG